MWVARDKNKTLWIHSEKPKRNVSIWETSSYGSTTGRIDPYLFPDLRWEDEPIEVDLVRKEVNHVDSER